LRRAPHPQPGRRSRDPGDQGFAAADGRRGRPRVDRGGSRRVGREGTAAATCHGRLRPHRSRSEVARVRPVRRGGPRARGRGGAGGLDVTLQFGRGYLMTADPCGAGCYQVVLEGGMPDSPVTVHLGGRAYRFDLPRVPAKPGGRIVAHATATWNALRSLVWHE